MSLQALFIIFVLYLKGRVHLTAFYFYSFFYNNKSFRQINNYCAIHYYYLLLLCSSTREWCEFIRFPTFACARMGALFAHRIRAKSTWLVHANCFHYQIIQRYSHNPSHGNIVIVCKCNCYIINIFMSINADVL